MLTTQKENAVRRLNWEWLQHPKKQVRYPRDWGMVWRWRKSTPLWALLLAAGISWGQTLTVSGPATALPGATVPLTLTLSGSTGQNIAGLEWILSTAAGATFSTPTASPTSISAGMGIYCNATNNLCILVGLSNANGSGVQTLANNAFTDGAAATVSFVIPPGSGVTPVTLSGLFAVSTTGGSITLTAGAPYTINILSKCDANQDGKVDVNDVILVIQAITGRASCPLAGGCNLQSLFAVMSAARGNACTL